MATSTPSKTSKSSKATTTAVEVLTPEMVRQATARRFKVETADKGLASAKSPKQLAAFMAGSVAAFQEASEFKQVAGAYTIAAGLKAGMQQKDIATTLGLAESTITLYKRLALALQKGISPTNEHAALWSLLSSKSGAGYSEVGKQLSSKTSTVDDIAAEVAKVIDPSTGEKRNAGAGSNNNGGSGSGSSNGGQPDSNGYDVPKGFKGKVEAMEAIIAGLPGDLTNNQVKDLERVGTRLAAAIKKGRKVPA